MVVSLGDALPFAVHLEEEKNVGEIDSITPALFQDAHDGKGFFDEKNVDSRLEIVAAGNRVDVMVELLDRTVFELAVNATPARNVPVTVSRKPATPPFTSGE